MNRDEKTAVVAEIADQINSAEAVFAVDYRGITVAQIADLRKRLREADARFRVVKNSLSERAADKAGTADLKPMLIGPTALAFVRGDAALAAKALNDAARQFHLLEFKGGLLNRSVLSADDVRSIARLPARDVLQGQLVATIAAPLTGLARGLNALIAGVAVQLQAIADLDPPVLARGEAAPAAEPEPVAAEPEAETAAAEPEAETAAAEPEAAAPAAEPEAGPPSADSAAAAIEPGAEPDPGAGSEPATAPEPEPEQPQKPETEAVSDAATSDDKEEA